ncbi:MAG: MATE family efflux transporter [Clostridiales bacterium]|nr:MATE family efflux transporter [Clostridiales bacterium]
MADFEKNMSEGSVLKNLILFALPLMASNVVQSLYGVVSMIIIGRFSGATAMSGVNIGSQVTLLLTNMVVGLGNGTTVLIGQYVGGENHDALKKTISTIITMLLGLAIVITPIMLLSKNAILNLIQTPPECFQESSDYLTITLFGIVFIFGYNAFSAILRGLGDSKRPFYFVVIANVTNILLALLLVGVLKLNVVGAAFSAVVGQAVSMICCIVYMIRNKFHFDFKPSSFRMDMTQLKLIIRFGLPTAIQNSITTLSFLFVTAIVNVVGGVNGTAAVGACGRFNGFAFMPIQAMSQSVSVTSAQNFGADRPERAAQACRIGIVVSALISFSLFTYVRMFPTNVISIFSSDSAVIESGLPYLRSVSFEQLVIPFLFCCNGLLLGGGHTTFTLMNSIISAILLRVPMSYFFGLYMGWGLFGVGMAAPITSASVLLIVTVFILTGRWKQNVVKMEEAKQGEPGV